MKPYTVSYVCLRCRKSFKRSFDPKIGVRTRDEKKCPDCSGPCQNCGRDFKAPTRTDDDQWKKVALLIEGGYRFDHVVRKGGDPNIKMRINSINTLQDAKNFLKEFVSVGLLKENPIELEHMKEKALKKRQSEFKMQKRKELAKKNKLK